MLSKLTLTAFLILLTSCASTGPVTDSFCETEKPILVSKSDVLTKQTAQEVLAHNLYGARKCGWK